MKTGVIRVSLENAPLAANDEAAHAELIYVLTIAVRKLQRLREEARLPQWERNERGALLDSDGNYVGSVALILESE